MSIGTGVGLGVGVGAVVGLDVGVGLALGMEVGLAWLEHARAGSRSPARHATTRRRGTANRFIGRHDSAVRSRELSLVSPGRGLLDLTDACRSFVAEAAAGRDGLLHVFVPHATAGVVIMELGSGSEADLTDTLDRLLPRDERWRHRHGSRGHGADHVMPLFAAPTVTVPVLDGSLALGTWQSLALLDPNGDNPRRQVRLTFVPVAD